MTSVPLKKNVSVHVVSDATGLTAERVIQAVLVQFSKQIVPTITRHPYLKNIKQLESILDEAESDQGLVIYSLVSKELREWIRGETAHRDIEIIDLLGPLLDRMGKLFKIMPTMHPGILSLLGEESIRLAESIDFTMRHDDGQGLETLGQADLIIVGVSRTSKTPTSIYLSCNYSMKVANVPLVLNVQPPRKIYTLKKPKKVGFTIDPSRLSMIRSRRYNGYSVDGYLEERTIAKELAYSRQIFSRIEDLQIIDVTYNTIEETANIITRQTL